MTLDDPGKTFTLRGAAHIDLLADPELWAVAPVEPATPPNPLKNDKEFLKEFPYLAEPW